MTVGRSPLDEWTALRRDLYLTTQNTHSRQTTMPSVEFEPTISASKLPQTYVLDGAVSGTGNRPIKIKVNCTLVQALRLCTGRTTRRGSGGIALLFLDHGTRRGWGVSLTPRPLFTPGKDTVPILQEAGWAPGQVWTGAENLAPQRDSIPGPSRP